MIVRSLLTRLGFSVDESNLRKYQQGTENIKRTAEGAATAFRNMFVAFAGFASLKSLANTADQMQSLQARIGLLPQTIGDAGAAFDVVAKSASDSRASIEGYATLYIRLAGATKDFITNQSDVLEITSAISDAMVVGGATMAEANSAMLQLSQGFQKGKLDGDEFRAFMETMSTGVKDKLAKALGQDSSAALFEMSRSGQLTAQNLAEAFREIGPSVREEMLKIPLTIGQSTTLVGNRWGEFIHRMNRESGAVTFIANLFTGAFDKIEIGLNRMVEFFGGAAQTLKFFGIALAAILLPLAANLLAGALAFIVSPLGLVIGGLVLLGIAIEDIYQWMNGGDSVIGDWLGKWEDVRVKIEENIFIVNAMIGVVGLLAAAVVTHFTVMMVMAAKLRAVMIWTWLGAQIQAVAASVSMVAAGAAMAASIIVASLPFLLMAAAIGLVIGAIYLLWSNWEKIMTWIGDISSKIWTSVSDGFLGMVDKIKGYWNAFKSFFGMDVSTKITASTAAGAASAPGGVPRGAPGGVTNVTVNQTLPPGTPAETAAAAKAATRQALNDNSMDRLARQAAQAQ